MRPANLYLTFICFAAFFDVSAQDVVSDSLFIRSFSTGDYRSSEFNYSVAEDKNGILFFANENGVLEYDGSSWRLHPIEDYSHIVTVQMSPDGRLYIGGKNEFGYMQRDSTGLMQYVSLRHLVASDLEMEEIWQIVFHKGQVYFQSYESLIRYDGELCHDTRVKDGWIYHRDDDVYVSVVEKGLGKLVGDSLVYINTDLKLEHDNPMICFPYRGREKILVTEFNGLYLIDTLTMATRKWDVSANDLLGEKDVWTAIKWNDSTMVFTLVGGGVVWVSNKGEVLKAIDSKSEFGSRETHTLYRDALGNLWVPGSGIHHFIWPEVNYTADATGVLIRDITINNERLYIDKRDTTITFDEFGPLKSLSINYTTPRVDKGDVHYSIYLEGFDKDWSAWNDETRKQYTNLAGGTYTFHVKSKFVTGEELMGAKIQIRIPIAWYSTPWAKVMGGLLVWLMVVGVYKLRTRHLKVRNRKLAALIEQRTTELRYANEELLKRNYELDQFVRRVSHDLVAPIKSAKALMEIGRSETIQAEQDKCFDMIMMSLSKQENFVKKLLDQAINYKEVNLEEVELKSFCQTVIEEMSNYDGAEHVTTVSEIPNGFTLFTDPIRLKIILKNLIDNSIKYRKLNEPSSQVTIRAYANDERIFIEIEDNGIGISEDQLEHIFGMFRRATEQRHGSGLGLYIVKDVVSSLGGKIELTSTLGTGSKFTLSFPKKEAHSQS